MKTKLMKLQFKRASLFMAMTIAAGSGFVSVANAQDGERLQLEEITVTARKRDESLQDAPYTITAITSQEIEVKGINELQDIVAFSPGFFYSENAVGKNSRESRRLIFRGMNPRTDLMHRQAASVFIDGAPTIGPEFGGIENVERIEVLKGPQGAHFGRSTYTGALNIITKDPGKEFSGKIDVTSGQYGLARRSVSLDGPLSESIGYRLTASTYETEGHYDNAAVSNQTLGDRSTDDFSLTLAFNPNDNLSAKLRFHTWKDDDGPDAATALDYRSGYTNCQPGGLVQRWNYSAELAAVYDGSQAFSGGYPFGESNVPLDYICGEVPMPSAADIGMDTGSPRALALMQSHLDGTFPLANGLRNTPNLVAPNHFGMEREAEEVSLNVNYNFDNGMNLNFIYAAHENSYGSHNDLDRRVTEDLDLMGMGGGIFGAFGANHPADAQDLRMQAMQDSSWEVRLSSSDDQKLRWTAGYSDVEMDNMNQIIGSMIVYYPRNEGVRTPQSDVPLCDSIWGGFPMGGSVCGNYGTQTSNSSNTLWATINTSAIYATLAYDVTDKLTVSAEVRRQKDEVSEGSYNYDGAGGWDTTEVRNASGEFTSTLPRFIVDYKPNEDSTIYLSYAEGSLPGLFNPALIGLSASQLGEIAAQTGGADVQVDEEVAENWEIGLKRNFLDGRGYVSAAYYSTDLTNVHIPSVAFYTGDDGVLVSTGNVTGQGGNAELSGLEIEGTVLMNENLTLGFTYALNDSELGSTFISPDTGDLMGDSTLAQGNEFSRYPKTSGSLSLDFNKGVAAGDMFARADFIYTGKMYASNAMLAHTGTGQKLNLRVGLDTGDYRLELFCTNCFEDEQPKGLQAMWDLSGITGGFGDAPAAAGPRVLAMSLPDKRVFGLRASFSF